MQQKTKFTLAVVTTALVVGLTVPNTRAQQEAATAAQPPATEGAAQTGVDQPTAAPAAEAVPQAPAEQSPAAESAAPPAVEQPTETAAEQEVAPEEGKEAAVDEDPAASAEEEAPSTASFYQQLMNIPPYRWDNMIDERRDYLTRRRQARYRDWSHPRRYWHDPWSAARSDAMREYSNARRDWSRDRSRSYRDLADAHRWYSNPWSAAQHQWSKALTNYSRLRSLAMQEQFDNMRYGHGYPGGRFGPYGGPGGGPYRHYSGFGGPWGPGGW